MRGDILEVRSELEKLIDLQITDTNIRRLKKSIESAETRRATIEQEFEQHAFSIREIQNKRDSLKAERDGFEKQIAENKTYLERADRNLKHAQNSKEYETAMRETDALQKQISALETQDLEKMEAIEEVEKELVERADEINSLESNRNDGARRALTPSWQKTARSSRLRPKNGMKFLPRFRLSWPASITAWPSAAATVWPWPRL